MEENQKKTCLVFNGSFGETFELPKQKGISYKISQDGKDTYTDGVGLFSYSFNFILKEPLIYFRDSMPLSEEDSNKEVINMLCYQFEEELKKILEK